MLYNPSLEEMWGEKWTNSFVVKTSDQKSHRGVLVVVVESVQLLVTPTRSRKSKS